MAKRRNSRSGTGKKWEPRPNDAIKLAALRWFACAAETQAIQLYATNSETYEDMAAIFRACITKLRKLAPPATMAHVPVKCPPGYVNCGGECAPQC